MSVLSAIWATSLVLATSAVLAMTVLIAVRLIRTGRAASRQVLKTALTHELLIAAEGNATAFVGRTLSRREQAILVDAGLELLDLVQGETAVRIVRLLARKGVVDVLRRWIVGPDPRRRAVAAEAMVYFADNKNLAALEYALRDRDQDVRLAAALSLVKLRAAPALPVLVRMLGQIGQRSERIRQILDAMLAENGDDVLQFVRDTGLSGFVRAKAIETIAGSGDLNLLPVLMELATDTNGDVRTAAIRGLGRLGHRAAADAIAHAFQDKDWYVRVAAVEAAGRIGLYELAPALTVLAEDSVWWVRFRAGEALAALDASGRDALRSTAAAMRGHAVEPTAQKRINAS